MIISIWEKRRQICIQRTCHRGVKTERTLIFGYQLINGRQKDFDRIFVLTWKHRKQNVLELHSPATFTTVKVIRPVSNDKNS